MMTRLRAPLPLDYKLNQNADRVDDAGRGREDHTPTAAEQITLEAIPKALERLAEGHVRGKIVARVQS